MNYTYIDGNIFFFLCDYTEFNAWLDLVAEFNVIYKSFTKGN